MNVANHTKKNLIISMKPSHLTNPDVVVELKPLESITLTADDEMVIE